MQVKMRRAGSLTACVVVLFVAMGLCSTGSHASQAPPEEALTPVTNSPVYLPLMLRGRSPSALGWEYEGISVSGYWSSAYALEGNAYDTIDYLASVGANTVSILSTWYQDTLTSTVMYPHSRITPDDAELGALIDYAHHKGLKVMLKPHIDPLKGWRANFAPTDPDQWFYHFKNDFILHYAQLAETHGVEIYCLGAEYDSMTAAQYEDEWLDIIASVRNVYHGKLTYAATEDKIKRHDLSVAFWRSLDYAALTVYFNVSDDRTPSVDDVVAGWHLPEHKAFLEQWYARHGKPIIFAEIGYRSVDYGGYQSYIGEGPNGCHANGPNYPACSIAYNGQGQANLYEGLMQAMGRQPWLAGIFIWQFEPRAGCQSITGGVGNIDYAFFGKPAGQVIHRWFGGSGSAPGLVSPDLESPLIDHFDYIDNAAARRMWLMQSSGDIELSSDAAIFAPVAGNSRSMRIASHVPDDDPRYAQLVGYFCEGHRDWSRYNSLEIWVRTDGLFEEPEGSEFSIALIDSRSAEREIWQSSRFLDRYHTSGAPDGWMRATISLTGNSDDNPWRHPTDFVVPRWEERQNGELDLHALRGVWIKSLTTENPSQFPDFIIWVDEAKVSTESVSIIPAPQPPVLDAFEYANDDDVRFVWKTLRELTGTIALAMDTAVKAPVPSTTRSMRVDADIPCQAGGLAEIDNYFLGGPLDLTGYRSLELWVRGDQIDQLPYGGELSVILIDADGERWQSTRWMDRMSGANAPALRNGWDRVILSLTSAGVGLDPWYHPADFVLPPWEPVVNGRLDLPAVQGIAVKSRTTDEHCAVHPRQVIWLDALQASTAAVTPPTLPALPTLDLFEYRDDDIARVIWKSASSGRVVLSMDASTYAPALGSTRSMEVQSNVPLSSRRYTQVCTTFLNGPLDFSPYANLEIWVRGDGNNTPPYGGEFSIILIEAGSKEKWQSTRWLARTHPWSQPIAIRLSGSGQGNPWDHPSDFVVPNWEPLQDGVLNLAAIEAVCIKALTTDQAASAHPNFTVWVDNLRLTGSSTR